MQPCSIYADAGRVVSNLQTDSNRSGLVDANLIANMPDVCDILAEAVPNG